MTPGELESENCMAKLKSFTCEWLCRPGFAMSEVAETLYKNKEIEDLSEEVFDASAYKKYAEMLSEVTNLCLPFWPDAIESEEDVPEVGKKLVKKNLKKLQAIFAHDDETAQGNFFNEYTKLMTELGGKMFLMGIQLRVMSSLLTNITDYSNRCTMAPNLNDFRENPSLSSLGDAIYRDIIDKRNLNKHKFRDTPRKSLKRFFCDAEEPSSSQSTPKKRAKNINFDADGSD